MADPVLPVVGAAIAAIGLLVHVRNGIDMIVRDKDHIEGYVITDVSMVGWRITLLSDQLKLWKRLWLLYEQTPYGLFVDYWGTAGAARILEVLETTEQTSRKIESEFESKHGEAQKKARERLESSGGLAKFDQTSERTRQKRLLARVDAYNYGLVRRTRLALFNSHTIQNHLKTLQESIESLENMSKSEFELRHHFKYDAEAAKKLGLRSHLLFLAEKAARTSAELIQWCKHQSLPANMAIDLRLDLAHGVIDRPRPEYIAYRADNRGFPFYLSLLNNADPEDSYINIMVANEAKIEELKQLVVLLGQEEQPERGDDIPSQDIESLEEVLSTRHRELLRSFHHHFPLPERYQLAYELSESALVLLASPSLCELCICAIRRYCQDDAEHEYEYYIRINNAHKLENRVEDENALERWCKKELLDLHLCRLGVVLTEICTGAVVQNARLDSRSKEIRMTLSLNTKSGDKLQDCYPEEVADLVKEAAGEDLSGAVYYCLRRTVTPDKVRERDLAAFYNRVVAPLYLHYENQVLKPREQRLSQYENENRAGA